MNLSYGMINFHYTAHALLAEKMLKRAGYNAEVMVPPPYLDEACNLGIKINLMQRKEVEKLLSENNIYYAGISPLEEDLG